MRRWELANACGLFWCLSRRACSMCPAPAPCAWALRLNACIATPSSMMICRRWMMMTCGVASQLRTKNLTRRRRYLAGDSLLTFAFEILALGDTHPDAKIRSALVLELAKASGKDGMAGGQMLDIEAEKESSSALDHIMRIQATRQAPSSALPVKLEPSWRALIDLRFAVTPMTSALPFKSPTIFLIWSQRLNSSARPPRRIREKAKRRLSSDGARCGAAESREPCSVCDCGARAIWFARRHASRHAARFIVARKK